MYVLLFKIIYSFIKNRKHLYYICLSRKYFVRNCRMERKQIYLIHVVFIMESFILFCILRRLLNLKKNMFAQGNDLDEKLCLSGWLMVFNATFNNIVIISWRSVLLVGETGLPGENHRPVASH